MKFIIVRYVLKQVLVDYENLLRILIIYGKNSSLLKNIS